MSGSASSKFPLPAPRKGIRWNKRDATRPLDFVFDQSNGLIAAIDPAGDVVLVRRGYEGFTTVGAWNAPTMSPPKYGYRAFGKQMVPMADGVRSRDPGVPPQRRGHRTFPTSSCAPHTASAGMIGAYWQYAVRGYAVVLQAAARDELRRSGREVGRQTRAHDQRAWRREGALDWIAAQSWSDGKICMQGGSYVGYTQWTAAMSETPRSNAWCPNRRWAPPSPTSHMWVGMLIGDGLLHLFMHERPLVPGRTWTEVMAHRPIVTLDDFGTGSNLPDWDRLVLNTTNGPSWKPRTGTAHLRSPSSARCRSAAGSTTISPGP